MFPPWPTLYCVFIPSLAKKKNKKGKTLTLTDFLAEDSPGGSSVPPSYPTKSTSWADETDDLEGDGEQQFTHIDFTKDGGLNVCKLNTVFCQVKEDK